MTAFSRSEHNDSHLAEPTIINNADWRSLIDEHRLACHHLDGFAVEPRRDRWQIGGRVGIISDDVDAGRQEGGAFLDGEGVADQRDVVASAAIAVDEQSLLILRKS